MNFHRLGKDAILRKVNKEYAIHFSKLLSEVKGVHTKYNFKRNRERRERKYNRLVKKYSSLI